LDVGKLQTFQLIGKRRRAGEEKERGRDGGAE